MTEQTLWWILSWALIAGGLAGTVLPLLPGTGLVLAGIVLGAWIDDFTRVGPWALGLITALAVLSWVLEFVASLLGARRVGASRLAVAGAAIGTVVGVFTGFLGLLFFPLVGAAVGEWLAHRNESRALRVGVATWIGLLIGLVAKVVLGFVMVGVFVAAWLI
jgi:uncharacterized protein YqgC (DUF456 family)